MTDVLSEEWAGGVAAAINDAYAVGAGNVTVTLTVGNTASGDVTVAWLSDGGEVGIASDIADPELAITIASKEFDRIMSGELTPSVAYMQGLLKSTGDTGLLLALIKAASQPVFESVRTIQ